MNEMSRLHRLVYLGSKLLTWTLYSRNYCAKIDPADIIYIKPECIKYKPMSDPGHKFIPSQVKSGNWDLEREHIKNDVVYKSFQSRFVEGKRWKDTEYFDFLKGSSSEHGEISESEIMERCMKIDRLYEHIHNYGYKSQPQIYENGDYIPGLEGRNYLPPSFREISIHISRSGEFLWSGGMHRLCIAKLLKLEEIPVRIDVRHFRWQEIRDEAIQGNTRDQYVGHPDYPNIK